MAAKLIKPKTVRGVRKEMECTGGRPNHYNGPSGCGARFTFVPSDTRVITITGNGRDWSFKSPRVERIVVCPACRRGCCVEVIRPGVEWTREDLARRDAETDAYGRGQGGH
jgi:hypothetical protein